MAPAVQEKSGSNNAAYKDRDKPTQIRASNMQAAKTVADAIRTSLGPRGMDKMIQSGNGDVTITNDGATILNQMQVLHPTAKMLVELSKAQDVEAGDGTTSVVVIAGSLLDAAQKLLQKGIHPTTISESFQRASTKAESILTDMSTPVDLKDNNLMINIASTSLNSKVVSQYSWLLAPMAVKAVMKIVDPASETVDLRNIKVIKKLGGTVEESELVEGALFDQKSMAAPGAPTRVEKAKVGLIQFQLSSPKTDMENQVIVSDYTQMDRVLREERAYILERCKAIKKAGCNVLLIQKSILRDAISDMALHFLAKMKIMVVKDVEREDIEFVCKSLGCRPVASVDHFLPEALGSADVVEQLDTGSGGKVIKVTGVQNPGKAMSVLIRGSNKLVLDEAERSFHDAICVIRCLVKKRALICGGGAPEMEVSYRLRQAADSVPGVESYCWRVFSEAMEVIPYTLAENAGLSPIATVTELRARHAQGDKNAGINVRKEFLSKKSTNEQTIQKISTTVNNRDPPAAPMADKSSGESLPDHDSDLAQGTGKKARRARKRQRHQIKSGQVNTASPAAQEPVETGKTGDGEPQGTTVVEEQHPVTEMGRVTNIMDEGVVQPLLVSMSAIKLATECVRSILKIDDIVQTKR